MIDLRSTNGTAAHRIFEKSSLYAYHYRIQLVKKLTRISHAMINRIFSFIKTDSFLFSDIYGNRWKSKPSLAALAVYQSQSVPCSIRTFIPVDGRRNLFQITLFLK